MRNRISGLVMLYCLCQEFVDLDDMYDYCPVSFIRVIECPYCGEKAEIDLEDYEYDISSFEKENGMGPDAVYSFDSEDNIECSSCGERYQVSGWIRENPMGAYDSEEINVTKLPDNE